MSTPSRPTDGRYAASERTRARVLSAARSLLANGGFSTFTVEAVARRAGVTRMTVYYQFESKTGLIEAVFNTLAIVRHGVDELVAAMALPDPHETLSRFVAVFGRVWEEDRAVIRRLQGLAALDPEFGRVWNAREGRRRHGLRSIVTRSVEVHGHPPAGSIEEVTAVLYALISFETYDVIAGPERPLEEVVPLVERLARAALRIDL